jgi:hypothetical protein
MNNIFLQHDKKQKLCGVTKENSTDLGNCNPSINLKAITVGLKSEVFPTILYYH